MFYFDTMFVSLELYKLAIAALHRGDNWELPVQLTNYFSSNGELVCVEGEVGNDELPTNGYVKYISAKDLLRLKVGDKLTYYSRC